MNRRPILLLVAALAWGPVTAQAQEYRFPVDGAPAYATAYVDHAGRDWNDGEWTYGGHSGTDFGIGGFGQMDAGRNVVAGAAGEVVAAHDGEFDRCTTADCGGGGGYGNHVRVRHADGKQTVYAHLKRGSVAVSVGDAVVCGQRLGQVGSSGWSSGPHLHFEVRTAGGGTDDPFAGPRSGPLSYWIDQGVYRELPTRSCPGGPEPAPLPDPEPPPEERLDDATFVSETLPDGSRVEAGSRFTKTWRVRNTGNTSWTRADDYLWTWDGEERLEAAEQVLLAGAARVPPGDEHTWAVEFTAPEAPGIYRSYWRMDRFGTRRFGDRVWLEIEVVAPPRDDAELVGEDPPSGQEIAGGERFTKVLHIRNTGNTTWSRAGSYLLTWDGDERFDAPDQVLLPDDARVEPGQEHTFEIPMQAPADPGRHKGFWRMDRFGTHRFGPRIEVSVTRLPPKPPPNDPAAPTAPADSERPDSVAEPTPIADESLVGKPDAPRADPAETDSEIAAPGPPLGVRITGTSGCATSPGAHRDPSPTLLLLLAAFGLPRR